MLPCLCSTPTLKDLIRKKEKIRNKKQSEEIHFKYRD
jgi:hypothetical protein